MSFFAAFRFLTVIPLPGLRPANAQEVGRSAVFFPLVGLVLGLILAGIGLPLNLFLPRALTSALLLAAMVLLTGAMHLDGFADTCDGLGVNGSLTQKRQAMKDSRIGAFGVTGLVLLLLLKFVSLSSLGMAAFLPALVYMSVLGRWAMAHAIFVFRYGPESGLGLAFKQGTRWPGFVIATATTAAMALGFIPLLGPASLVVPVAVWVVTGLAGMYFSRKFDGLTGDNYGAINEIAELTTLIAIITLTWRGLL